MNRKQLTILLVLVVLLGAAGLMVYNRDNSARKAGNPEIGRKLLGNLPVNDITQVTIKHGTNQVTLEKKDDLWRVRERNDYPANYQEIADFLMKARDLKVVQTETVGASQLPRLELAPGAGTNAPTEVDLKDQGGKTVRTLLLGKKHMRKSNRPSPMGMGDMGDEGWPDGRYVKVGADSKEVALISDALTSIEPRPEQWLNKDFIKIEKIRSISVTATNATNSFKLTRETENGEWKLADAKPTEQLDTSKASGVTSSIGSPSFSDVLPLSETNAAGLQSGPTIAISTFDDFNYTLKAGTKTNDNYPLLISVDAKIASERPPVKDEKPADKDKLDKEFKEKQKKLEEKLAQEKAYEKAIYLVSSWTLDSALKDRGSLMVEKKPETKPGDTNAPPASVTPPVGNDEDTNKDEDKPTPLAPTPAK